MHVSRHHRYASATSVLRAKWSKGLQDGHGSCMGVRTCVDAGITTDTPPRSGDTFRCLHLHTSMAEKIGRLLLGAKGKRKGDLSDPVLGRKDLSIRPALTRQP